MKFPFAKGVATGLAVATVLTPTFVYATVGKQNMDAIFRDIKIVLNGRKVNPTDANGKAVEPFIVDGTTYLPIRAVANAFATDVSWDGKTNTIYLGEQPTSDVVGLDDSAIYKSSGRVYGAKTFKVRGEDIPVFNYIDSSSTNVILDCKYKTLKAKIFVKDGINYEESITIKDIDTGDILFQDKIQPLEKPINITVNIKGIDKLSIQTFGVIADITVE